MANVIVVSKKDGRIKVYMGYKDLNKASLNDDFPLPYVDEFLAYNQIRMAEENKEKIIFVMPWGTFYYKMMSFELRNADATSTALKINGEHDTMSFFFNMQFFIRKKKFKRCRG